MASSITIPGQQLGLYEAFSYSGPTRRQAHTQIFGDLEIEFLLMGNTPEQAREIYLLMTEWHEKIAGPHVEGSQTQSLIPSIPTIDTDAFNVEYYDNYVTNASIDIYSPMVSASTSKPIVILHNTYYGLFPVNVGALTTSWESPDAPMTLPVTFTYYYVRSTIPAQ